MLFCHLLIYFKIKFFKTFQEYHQSTDQAQIFVRLDLGQKCLQRLSADDNDRQSVFVKFMNAFNVSICASHKILHQNRSIVYVLTQYKLQ